MYQRSGFDDGSSNREAAPTVSAERLSQMRSGSAVRSAPRKSLLMSGAALPGLLPCGHSEIDQFGRRYAVRGNNA